MKKLSLLFIVLCSLTHIAFSQSRVNREKESFTSVVSLLGTTSEWELRSDGTWHQSKSDHHARVTTIDATPTRPKGFHDILFVTFKANDKQVYALAYVIGYWSYRYEHIEIEPYEYERTSYYFFTKDELSKILNLEEGEVTISFSGYVNHKDEDVFKDQDKVIYEYKSGPYTYDGPFTARLRVTEQDGQKVLRFTVPYDDRQKKVDVFERGPYYEISLSKFKSIKRKIKNNM